MSAPLAELRARAAAVRLLILDVDGVLTDGRLVYGATGEELKIFHVRDGLGIRMALDAGIEVAVITARKSEPLAARMRDLRIRHYIPGRDDKLAAFRELLASLELAPEQCCFVGDDILDLPVLRQVGLSVGVADAHALVRSAVHLLTTATGGAGAVREITDLLLDSRHGLARATEEFLDTKVGRGTLEKV